MNLIALIALANLVGLTVGAVKDPFGKFLEALVILLIGALMLQRMPLGRLLFAPWLR